MNEQARHLYVVAEHFEGKLRPVTMELIGKAHELAEASGEKVHRSRCRRGALSDGE